MRWCRATRFRPAPPPPPHPRTTAKAPTRSQAMHVRSPSSNSRRTLHASVSPDRENDDAASAAHPRIQSLVARTQSRCRMALKLDRRGFATDRADGDYPASSNYDLPLSCQRKDVMAHREARKTKQASGERSSKAKGKVPAVAKAFAPPPSKAKVKVKVSGLFPSPAYSGVTSRAAGTRAKRQAQRVVKSLGVSASRQAEGTILRVNEALNLGYVRLNSHRKYRDGRGAHAFLLENVFTEDGKRVPHLCRNVPVHVTFDRADRVAKLSVDAEIAKLLAMEFRAHNLRRADPADIKVVAPPVKKEPVGVYVPALGAARAGNSSAGSLVKRAMARAKLMKT